MPQVKGFTQIKGFTKLVGSYVCTIPPVDHWEISQEVGVKVLLTMVLTVSQQPICLITLAITGCHDRMKFKVLLCR